MPISKIRLVATKRLVGVSVLLLLLGARFIRLPSPLPTEWSPNDSVGYTVTILDQPKLSDSKTVVRRGIWVIELSGYHKIIPGERLKFVGKVSAKKQLGKVVELKMVDPSYEVVGSTGGLLVSLFRVREKWLNIIGRSLPEPMASLAGGILLGVNDRMPYQFYQQLVESGTLHLVAASGYNVSVVAEILLQLVGHFLSRGPAVIVAVGGIVVYVIISGGSASVIRAGIMGSLTLIAYYTGRPAEARRILWVTIWIMLWVNPLLIMQVGFQLSVAATAGLLYIEPWMRNLKSGLLQDYLFPTLAATIATMPIIYWHFGRVSWIAPLANVLILPVVPGIMLLSGGLILAGSLSLALGQVVAWVGYVPLWWVVGVIRWFGQY